MVEGSFDGSLFDEWRFCVVPARINSGNTGDDGDGDAGDNARYAV